MSKSNGVMRTLRDFVGLIASAFGMVTERQAPLTDEQRTEKLLSIAARQKARGFKASAASTAADRES